MSHPVPTHDRDNELPFDEYSAGPRGKALGKKIKVQSTQHGKRRMFHSGGKMKEAPLIELKRLTSQKKK